ncbi:MAG: hypothetical protein HY820_05880 [Acidobacteria bacterium]|nr:hypothetical protein [Acidobacteriota bacterium]
MQNWTDEFPDVLPPVQESAPALVSQAVQLLDVDRIDSEWLENALCWVLEASREKHNLHLMALETAIRQHPASQEVITAIAHAVRHLPLTRFLAETGIPDHPTVWKEAGRRAVDKVFAKQESASDLHSLLDRLPLTEQDVDWLESLPEQRMAFWRPVMPVLDPHLRDAVRLLAYRIAGVALSRELLALQPEFGDGDSPFYSLPQSADYWLSYSEDPRARLDFEDRFVACLRWLRESHLRLDDRGVSMDLVFRLELLEAQMERMRKLVSLTTANGSGTVPLQPFMADLVRAGVRRKSVRDAISAALRRLTRKVVEHTGETGEHYVVNSWGEWKAMFRAGSGGGLVTVGTAIGKFLVAALHLAPGATGTLLWADYAASFLAMQFCGFSLASKQPAMTASALAKGMELDNGTDEEVALIAAICRSQTAVTLGNLLIGIPASFTVGMLWSWMTGGGAVSVDEARHTVEGLQVFSAWNLAPLAALTGVYLWLASLVAGWAANWSNYRRFPEAVATSRRLRVWLGHDAAVWLGARIRQHWSGGISMVSLGFFLGFVPMIWMFIGFDLPVRHVTLQAASFAIAGERLWWDGLLHRDAVVEGLTGIAVVAFFNFAVSFYLSLKTAMRARGLAAADRRHLWKDLWSSFREAPGRFLWSERLPEAACFDRLPHPPDP